MDELQEQLLCAASSYAEPGLIVRVLGFGTEGIVVSSSRGTAIKAHLREVTYLRELRAYFRLLDHQVTSICGHAVPELYGFNKELRVIEMSVVEKPYVLDFGKATLDGPPADFPPEVWEQWQTQREEEFGDNWPHAATIFHQLKKQYGIWYVDLSPRNVGFA